MFYVLPKQVFYMQHSPNVNGLCLHIRNRFQNIIRYNIKPIQDNVYIMYENYLGDEIKNDNDFLVEYIGNDITIFKAKLKLII